MEDSTGNKLEIPADWVLLDIERKKLELGEWKLWEIALVDAGGEQHEQNPDLTTLHRFLDQIEQAEVILGHNIRRHDIPELYEQGKRKQPAELDAKICDTLELSSLFLIGEPTHKLNKLYRKELGLNDPLKDAWESCELYQKVDKASSELPSIVAYWAGQLLPDGYPLKLIHGGENDWDNFKQRLQSFPLVDVPALQNYLESLPKGKIENLGAVAFLNWLYQLDKPETRRPGWLETEFPRFREAENRACPIPLEKNTLTAELKHFFGLDDFREGQLEIAQALLKGETVPLGILPTGGGKSLTFQLPALILSRYRRGLSIIVSPLQALMEDQVTSLKKKLENQQIPEYAERVELLAGTQSLVEQRRVIEAIWNGQVDILYLSPERLRQPTIQRIFKHRLPHLWVLDEAHTLSQWGHDFRPDFLRIAQTIQRFYEYKSSSTRWGFVTATATPKVVKDLQDTVKHLSQLFTGSLQRLPSGGETFSWRKEITTHVEIVEQPQAIDEIEGSERLNKTIRYLEKGREEYLEKGCGQGVAIVYVSTRRMAEKYAEELTKANFKAKPFHSRFPEKQQVLADFKDGKLDVVVATNAFGMGIDREGIHTVIHVAPPATPEAYLQEIGRLARKKGEQGSAYLFCNEEDFGWIFEQEIRSQIHSQALRSCWDLIRPRLREEEKEKSEENKREAWVSTLDLAKPLAQEDPELLATQVRLALYYLEKSELIREEESCPCYLYICLKRELNQEEIEILDSPDKKLKSYFWDIGLRNNKQSIKLDVRETSLATTLHPPAVIQGIRQLVNAGIAEWEYKIAFKLETKFSQKIKEFQISTQAFLDWLREESPEIDDKSSILLNIEVLQEKLIPNNFQTKLRKVFKFFEQLNLAKYSTESRLRKRFYLKETQTLTEWLDRAYETSERICKEIHTVELALDKLFKNKNWERDKSQLLDIAELEKALPKNKESPPINLLEVLAIMQSLDLVVMGRGALGFENLYRLRSGNRQNWSDGVFKPLDEHYEQRGRRIYAMRHVLLASTEQKQRIEILRDYFSLSLDEFERRYLPEIKNIEGGFRSPPIVQNILENLNQTQKRIVTDDQSRALLVLAGPGSGKTHTIVRRVGYLVSARGVPPEKILILAYNRSAAAEVRKRLCQLLGSRGTRVDALTFHALAAKLTRLRSSDIPQEVKGENRFNWLLKQAIAHLEDKENHPGYQYILVDEYQDIDDLQYKMITLLAGFDRQDEDESQKSFLVAVGDDDQNLYEFNGARIEFIHRFRQDYQVANEAVVPLLENYRSRPAIVDFANRFIESAIPKNRLKGVNGRVEAVNIQQPGQVFWGEYRHKYHAAEWIAEKIADLLTRPDTSAEKVAVLAHRWDDLRFLQHVLRKNWGNDGEIAYQFYSTKDDFRPANSRVGQAIVECLQKDPGLRVPDAKAHLEQLRQNLGYSDRDAAWSALLHALEGFSAMTQEEIAYILEEARPLRPGRVILSTFHSAKGSEFSHVFVLEDGFLPKTKLESRARELYVGFTRAKEELYVLFTQDRQKRHPELQAVLAGMKSLHVVQIQVPVVQLPHSIHYYWFPELRDLFLSENRVINQYGRSQIEAYAREWGNLDLDTSNRLVLWSSRGNRLVAVFSGQGREKLNSYLKCGKQLVPQGHTVLRVERNDEFYQRAGYQGTEDHHYVVLPYFQVEEALQD